MAVMCFLMYFTLALRSPWWCIMVRVLPKVTISGWRWGTWLEISKGTRETVTGAHLGGRGARRRRSYSAIATHPPRGVDGRRGHGDVVMGATTHGLKAIFKTNF